MPDLTDEEIAQRVQTGDTESFGLLVERYERKMLRYARKFLFGHHDAEDMAQDVFLKAYEHIQSFNTSMRFSPWLYRIAHNTYINAIKKKGTEPMPFFDPDTLFPHPVANEQTDRDAITKDLRTSLDTCLNELDAKYREPIVLFYYEELSYKEIADIVRIPQSTVGVRIKRGKDQLLQLYKKKYEPV